MLDESFSHHLDTIKTTCARQQASAEVTFLIFCENYIISSFLETKVDKLPVTGILGQLSIT